MKSKAATIQSQAKKALKSAIRKVIAEHKLTGDPLYIWKNGRVQRVSPDKLK